MAQLSLNKDYITVYDGVIQPRLCDNLIEFFEKNWACFDFWVV